MDKSVIVSRKHSVEKEMLAIRMRQNMTAAERMLWERLRRNQVGGLRFRRQQIIESFIADFYCHTARLVIEADGGVITPRRTMTGNVTKSSLRTNLPFCASSTIKYAPTSRPLWQKSKPPLNSPALSPL